MRLIHYIKKKKSSSEYFIKDEDNEIKYYDFISNVEKISFYIKKRKRIVVFTENTIEFIVMIIACFSTNSKFIVLNPNFFYSDLNQTFKKFNPDLIVATNYFLKFLKKDKKIKNKIKSKNIFSIGDIISDELNYSKIVNSSSNLNPKKIPINSHYGKIICSSSGTTDKPKNIIFNENIFVQRALASCKIYDITKKNFLVSTPLFHTLAIKVVCMAIVSGSNILLINKFTKYNWNEFSKYFNKTIWHTASSQIKELIINNRKFLTKKNNLDLVISAADSLGTKFKKKIIQNNLIFYDTYGTTETDGISSIKLTKNIKNLDSVGQVNSTHKVKILFGSKLCLLTNKIGEICCKTKLIFKKIENNKKNNFINGYYKTGDLGYFDKDKNLYITGRKHNIINISGLKVSPEKIEKEINKIRYIKNCVVYAQKNLIKGEQLMCLIQTEKKIDKKKIYTELLKKIPSHFLPSDIKFVKKINTNDLGKNQRY